MKQFNQKYFVQFLSIDDCFVQSVINEIFFFCDQIADLDFILFFYLSSLDPTIRFDETNPWMDIKLIES